MNHDIGWCDTLKIIRNYYPDFGSEACLKQLMSYQNIECVIVVAPRDLYTFPVGEAAPVAIGFR